MKYCLLMGTFAVILAAPGNGAAPLKSGPQAGGEVAAFHSLNLTGAAAGQKACQV